MAYCQQTLTFKICFSHFNRDLEREGEAQQITLLAWTTTQSITKLGSAFLGPAKSPFRLQGYVIATHSAVYLAFVKDSRYST
jgi:hypothetical protein